VSRELPLENERLTVILAREDDDATTAVAFWSVLADRLGLADVVVRNDSTAPKAFHPTRSASLVDRGSGAVLGHVGEVDDLLMSQVAPSGSARRLGVLDVDVDALADPSRATRRDHFARVPSRYPSAVVDLAFVTPSRVHAQDLAHALRNASELVEDVQLFDVYLDASLPEGTRSLAFNVRFSSDERTLNEAEVAKARETLISAAADHGAVLR
jgi:phenylalanyl-tRNA synthetase beta chain